MRLRHIEVFHEVYRLGSMTQAARALNVSQPSVSKVLAHAEAQIGFQLFVREGNRLVATPEGERLYPHAQAVFAALDQTRQVATNLLEAASGNIRLAFTPALGVSVLPSLISAYKRQRKEVVFGLETLHLDGIAHALAEAGVDLGLAFEPPKLAGIAETVLREDALTLIAPAALPLPPHASLHWRDLHAMPLIRLDERSPLGQRLSATLAQHGVEPATVASAETYQVAASLVSRGLGAAVVDACTAEAAQGDGVVSRRLEPEVRYRVSLLRPEGTTPSPGVADFMRFTREQLSD